MGEISWFVYILSCSDNSYYTGITNNLNNRLLKHNKGVGAKYTRSRLPVSFVYIIPSKNRSTASKEEYRIKSLTRAKKIELIQANLYNLKTFLNI